MTLGAPDSHWFYSSLAQCAATVAGLVGGFLGVRLPPQLVHVITERKALQDKVTKFIASAEGSLENANKQIAGGRNSPDIPTRERVAEWDGTLDVLGRLATIDTIYALRMTLPELVAQHKVARLDASAPLRSLQTEVETILADYARLRAVGSTQYLWSVWGVLLLLCGSGLIAPLTFLEGNADNSKVYLLVLFAVGVGGLLWALEVFIRRIEAGATVTSLRRLHLEL